MKRMLPMDNPFNGDEEDLGMFILSPGTLKMRNLRPLTGTFYFWYFNENRFNDENMFMK